ncbi:MAG: NADH:ubiquinone oxidoreductase [Thelocarpon superellum]|nr:MAG: NADH:ubiquinone oxidoreductase [Thelocarpon superellum]
MPSADEPPSSPASVPAFTSLEESLTYYKSQYEQLEAELADFQASSQELEAELERDVEASEKRERLLKEKVEGLGYEVDEWKAKYKQSKSEANTSQNTLQKEITTLRDANRTMQLKLRDIEVANDDFERQARNTTSSLEDLESKYNVAIERAVMLEAEIQVGEQERESLRIETQRLRDELGDLKIEAEITQGKLRHLEGAAQQEHQHKPSPLTEIRNPPHSPTSDRSLLTTGSSPTMSTPPRPKSASTSTSEAPTPPSPPTSEASAKAAASTANPPPPASPAEVDNTTPRPSQFQPRLPRHSRGPSIPVSSGRGTPSIAPRSATGRGQVRGTAGMPSSGSLRQIRGLIGQMQKLEQRVHSARSKLPAPVCTPPHASPRNGSAAGHHPIIPSSVTMRSPKKRTGGSNISAMSSVHDGDGTPTASAASRRVSRLSYCGGPAATTTTTNNTTTEPGGSRPSSRASISSRTSINPHGGYPRPGSRASLSGARTPLGHFASNGPALEGRRPRSSVSGSYAAMHGHGHAASVDGVEERDERFSTPTPRRSLIGKADLAGESGIPTPSGIPRRQSGGGAAFKPFGGPMTPGVRRPSSSMQLRDVDEDMAPPERRKKLSGVGETY